MTHPVLAKIAKNSPHLDWLPRKTVLLVRHGSKAYGTDVEGSDDDYKGVCIPPKQYFYGMQHHFEQAELHEPDVVVYELRKFFALMTDNNPNAIETLFTDPEDRLVVSPIGEIILANRDRFLSKNVRFRFSGYAVSQLKRIKLHRKYLLNPITKPPTRADFGLPEQTLIPQDQLLAAEAEIRKELEKYQFDFLPNSSESEKIQLRGIITTMMGELKLTADDQWFSGARRVGLDDNFILLMQQERQYNAKRKEWEQYQKWKEERNPKRAADEAKYQVDLKHAYHLVRLIRMAKEILTTGKVLVKRPDREELLAIRHGAWSYEQIVEWAEKEDKELGEIYKTCNVLPKEPDRKYLDALCIELVERSLSE